jgi:hypothetical protein
MRGGSSGKPKTSLSTAEWEKWDRGRHERRAALVAAAVAGINPHNPHPILAYRGEWATGVNKIQPVMRDQILSTGSVTSEQLDEIEKRIKFERFRDFRIYLDGEIVKKEEGVYPFSNAERENPFFKNYMNHVFPHIWGDGGAWAALHGRPDPRVEDDV